MTNQTAKKSRDKLQLGLFMPNCSYSLSFSSYKPDPTDWTYETNLKIARAAEDAHFNFLFPVSKWRGYGGKTDALSLSLETFTWASALLSNTKKIKIFSTVHVPVFHPVATAKMGSTLDHISNGRWGLNVVSGWSEREFSMMGIEVIDHKTRYERSEAYIEILKGLWTQEPGTFNYECPWYKITGGDVQPRPVQNPHPTIANAGGSEDAKEMVSKLCDWSFITPPDLEAAKVQVLDIKDRAKKNGRNIFCATPPFVLWRDSESEAFEEKEKILEQMDVEALENWASGLAVQSGSFDKHTLEMYAVGAGGIPMIGTKEQVAEMIREIYDYGMDGLMMVFLDYLQDTVNFKKDISPILKKMGIR